jgi:hypothetical protein
LPQKVFLRVDERTESKVPHKPSPQKFVRDYLLRHAFHDRERAESVNTSVSREHLRTQLLARFKPEKREDYDTILWNMPEWLSDNLGEVLTDSRGHGFMQG